MKISDAKLTDLEAVAKGSLASICGVTWCDLIADLREARTERDQAHAHNARLMEAAEAVYAEILANLDNMSRHNQDALRPSAMRLLTAMSDEDDEVLP